VIGGTESVRLRDIDCVDCVAPGQHFTKGVRYIPNFLDNAAASVTLSCQYGSSREGFGVCSWACPHHSGNFPA